jgi:hypothetical protein
MNEPPTIPSTLGIEAVQWLAEGGENLTVRIRGRWRRGRPTWSGQPLLVIDAASGRHRFPAMPEPPSLTGAAPGTWQMTFAVPAGLAPRRGLHAWLQLGGAVVVPLPIPVPAGERASEASGVAQLEPSGRAPPSEITADGAAPDPEARLLDAELAAESARRRAAEAEGAVAAVTREMERLEAELERVRGEPTRLNALLLERERQLRAARQRAHAEHAGRLALEAAQRESERSAADRAGHALRVAELEEEIETVRRTADEAEHLAQAAQAARLEAERRLAEADAGPARAPAAIDARLVRDEQEMVASRPGERRIAIGESPPAAGAEPPSGPGTAHHAESTADDLRRELQAHEELQAALVELRVELDRLRVDAERERAARIRAEAEAAALRRDQAEQTARSARAWEAIALVRSELGSLRNGGNSESNPATAVNVGAAPPPAPATSASVEPERFAEALARLRAATPPTAPEEAPEPERASTPEEPAKSPSENPWLERALRDVARADRPSAERLVASLAPDLELDRSKLIERMAAGRIRRALARLRRRPAIPVELREVLRTQGAMVELELEPQPGLWLVAVMIDRSRTTAESFTIAYRRPAALDPALYLQVWERDRSVVRDTAPGGRITATVVCPPESLTRVLAGRREGEVSVIGDERPLELVRAWIDRAQSD